MSLHDQLLAAEVIRPLDHELARSLQRLRPETEASVLAAAALASLAVSLGHAGFDPARPSMLLPAQLEAPLPVWPGAAEWTAALQASPWVAQPAQAEAEADSSQPLVYEGGLLYLRRYREYERRLAAGLQRIAAVTPPASALAPLQPLFALLFPQASSGEDLQARAAELALQRNLLLVTGGPGTGKTTTIARMLLLRLAQAQLAQQSPPRIALAAPTGRAADRMAESLHRAAASNPEVDPALRAALPERASTLHRLLGVIPDSPRFRHHAENQLPYDIIVVDEASMVDLPMMCKLVEAIADGTQLVLLGDPDQLPSVETGDVLAAILKACGDGEALAGHRVQLKRGYRQTDSLQLAPLAQAMREGDAGTALTLLRGKELSGVHFHEAAEDPLRLQGAHLFAHWQALANASDPETALQQAGRLRILTAVREGPQGARGLNARIEQRLANALNESGRTGRRSPWFQGRLLLITENSYRHGLFNGDVGVCLRDQQGTMLAWFAGADGPRPFHPAALPAHESAFAMTVHKAQGSEFDEVWLQLPRRDNRVLSRELLYTGATRARSVLHLAGSEEVVRSALARHAARISGLAWRLQT